MVGSKIGKGKDRSRFVRDGDESYLCNLKHRKGLNQDSGGRGPENRRLQREDRGAEVQRIGDSFASLSFGDLGKKEGLYLLTERERDKVRKAFESFES